MVPSQSPERPQEHAIAMLFRGVLENFSAHTEAELKRVRREEPGFFGPALDTNTALQVEEAAQQKNYALLNQIHAGASAEQWMRIFLIFAHGACHSQPDLAFAATIRAGLAGGAERSTNLDDSGRHERAALLSAYASYLLSSGGPLARAQQLLDASDHELGSMDNPRGAFNEIRQATNLLLRIRLACDAADRQQAQATLDTLLQLLSREPSLDSVTIEQLYLVPMQLASIGEHELAVEIGDLLLPYFAAVAANGISESDPSFAGLLARRRRHSTHTFFDSYLEVLRGMLLASSSLDSSSRHDEIFRLGESIASLASQHAQRVFVAQEALIRARNQTNVDQIRGEIGGVLTPLALDAEQLERGQQQLRLAKQLANQASYAAIELRELNIALRQTGTLNAIQKERLFEIFQILESQQHIPIDSLLEQKNIAEPTLGIAQELIMKLYPAGPELPGEKKLRESLHKFLRDFARWSTRKNKALHQPEPQSEAELAAALKNNFGIDELHAFEGIGGVADWRGLQLALRQHAREQGWQDCDTHESVLERIRAENGIAALPHLFLRSVHPTGTEQPASLALVTFRGDRLVVAVRRAEPQRPYSISEQIALFDLLHASKSTPRTRVATIEPGDDRFGLSTDFVRANFIETLAIDPVNAHGTALCLLREQPFAIESGTLDNYQIVMFMDDFAGKTAGSTVEEKFAGASIEELLQQHAVTLPGGEPARRRHIWKIGSMAMSRDARGQPELGRRIFLEAAQEMVKRGAHFVIAVASRTARDTYKAAKMPYKELVLVDDAVFERSFTAEQRADWQRYLGQGVAVVLIPLAETIASLSSAES